MIKRTIEPAATGLMLKYAGDVAGVKKFAEPEQSGESAAERMRLTRKYAKVVPVASGGAGLKRSIVFSQRGEQYGDIISIHGALHKSDL
jgi:hypothetical protein